MELQNGAWGGVEAWRGGAGAGDLAQGAASLDLTLGQNLCWICDCVHACTHMHVHMHTCTHLCHFNKELCYTIFKYLTRTVQELAQSMMVVPKRARKNRSHETRMHDHSKIGNISALRQFNPQHHHIPGVPGRRIARTQFCLNEPVGHGQSNPNKIHWFPHR